MSIADDINNGSITEISMRWMPDGEKALAEFRVVILAMYRDFLDFKKAYPENVKIPIQEARFEKLNLCLEVWAHSMINEISFRSTISQLRATVGFQLEAIAYQNMENEELKMEIVRLKNIME